MSKINIYETDLMKAIDSKSYLKKMTSFLAHSRGTISISDKISSLIYNPSNILLNTIISDLFKLFLKENKIRLFSFIDLSSKKDIPEILLFNYINIDVLQLKHKFDSDYNVLKSFPEYNDRIIYNITDIISSNNTKIDGGILQQTIIRDLLSRSYFNFDENWLTPSILYYLTKFYAIPMSSNLGRIYNLNYQDQMMIATIFAIFFLQHCQKKPGINPIIGRMDFLNRFINIKDITDVIEKEYKNKDLTFEDVASIIKILLPQRLSSLNAKSIYTLGRNANLNQVTSLISTEYPPYWCYNVLLAISGIKSNLYHTLKKLNMLNDLTKFGVEIRKSNQLISSVF